MSNALDPRDCPEVPGTSHPHLREGHRDRPWWRIRLGILTSPPFKGPRIASLRKPTVWVPNVTRRATAWDRVAVTFAPFQRPCAAGQSTTAKHNAVIHEGRAVTPKHSRYAEGPSATAPQSPAQVRSL